MSQPEAFDVVVVGAGAAGLTAAAQLANSGLKVIILEAHDRIGGRIYAQHDPVLDRPIELGAEFIHGMFPEIWEPLQSQNISIHEVEGDNWCVRQNQLSTCDFFEDVNKILEQMDARQPDESFLSFLQRKFPDAGASPKQKEILERAVAYVSGFNAADPDRVGVHWLVKGMEGEETIEGGRAFRSEHGYQDLLGIMHNKLASANVAVQTHTMVTSVVWKRGHVEVAAHRHGAAEKFSAKAVLITLPLGVLKASAGETGTVRFAPALPTEKLEALSKLEMGKASRVTLRFRERFWEELSPQGTNKNLSQMSFLFSQDEWFPTWWTTMPKKLPTLTGWAAFRRAEKLSAESCSRVGEHAVETIAALLHLPLQEVKDQMETAYFHDWQNDPFSRGAYSYGAVGADGAQEALGNPVENTLFFAGEATDTSGNNGTVHAAIASGNRAAREILQRNS